MDPTKNGQEHFDLSSDEEEAVDKNRSQPENRSVYDATKTPSPEDDEVSAL